MARRVHRRMAPVAVLVAGVVVALVAAVTPVALPAPAQAAGPAATSAWPVLSPDGSGQGRMVLVLDASGSMKEPHGDGRTRFQAAVSALRKVVGALPGDLDVGLRIYGSRISDGPGSCQDSRLAVPVGPVDKGALRGALGKARPLGNTPIAYSLQEAAKDLADEGSRTVVLVSDGEESCGGDPCQVARDLTKQGLDLHVDVVGFQVDDKARNQLTCVAQAGRGTFYDAPDASALVSQLSRLSARAARAYVPKGIPVEGTDTAADAPTLEPGQYLDTIGDGSETETYLIDPPAQTTVHVSATDRPTRMTLTDSEKLELLVTTADGRVCDQRQGVGSGAFDKLTPITAAVSVDGKDLATCGPGPYALTVNRIEGSEVKPLEVTYVEEPAVTTTGGLPAAAKAGNYTVKGDASGPATPVFGSPSFTAAPLLEPGVYKDSILVGETLFYGVELDWGQQLVCDVSYGRSPSVHQALGYSRPTATVKAYGPLHDAFFDPTQGFPQDRKFFDASRPLSVRFSGPPVRYLNRDGGLGEQPASLPGTYYCAAYLNGDIDFGAAGEVPITVGISVVGTAGEGAPSYVEEQSPSASPAPADDQEKAAADPAASEDGGIPVWGWLVGLLVVLALALAVLSRRAARRPGSASGSS